MVPTWALKPSRCRLATSRVSAEHDSSDPRYSSTADGNDRSAPSLPSRSSSCHFLKASFLSLPRLTFLPLRVTYQLLLNSRNQGWRMGNLGIGQVPCEGWEMVQMVQPRCSTQRRNPQKT